MNADVPKYERAKVPMFERPMFERPMFERYPAARSNIGLSNICNQTWAAKDTVVSLFKVAEAPMIAEDCLIPHFIKFLNGM